MLDLRSTIADVRADGRSRSTRCSAHEDKRASLSISRGNDGRVLLRCHAGCASEAVLEAAGLTWADVHERSNGHHAEIVATYDYRDEGGALIYQVCRFEPKDFRQRRPDGSGEWLWNTKGVRSLLYHLDKLRSRDTVIVAEGEKDVDRLWSLDLPATCNAGGAGKWKSTHTQQLVGAGVKRVTVIPDADEPGRRHADSIARSCAAAGLTVKLVTLPDGAKDVSEWLDAGATKAKLVALSKAAPVYTPDAEAIANANVAAVPVIQRLSEVKRESVRWIWTRRLARGKLALLPGEPGEGKSTLVLDLAARISTGAEWPDGGHAPLGDVLILSAEDGLSDTIAPRLDAGGADSGPRSRAHGGARRRRQPPQPRSDSGHAATRGRGEAYSSGGRRH